MAVKITRTATDKAKGLTLAEVRDLLGEADRVGLTDGRLRARMGFRGNLLQLEISEAPE